MEDKKQEPTPKIEEKVEKKEKMRQIIIETDGDKIGLVKAEVSGRIELVGVLENLISYLNQQK